MISEFYDLVVPPNFKKSILNLLPSEKYTLTCMSPWCKSYGTTDNLVKTATPYKKTNSGMFIHRQACLDCGCEFAYNGEQFVEMNYFHVGYTYLERFKSTPYNLTEFSRISGLDRSSCKRIMSYFHVRNLFDMQVATIKRDLINMMVESIKAGARVSDLQALPYWTNELHFLIHRYHPMVMEELILVRRTAKERLPKEDFYKTIKNTCEKCLQSDITITIRNIAKMVGTTTATINKWGYSSYIIEMKKNQYVIRLELKKNYWISKVNQYLNENVGIKIYSKDLYEHINVRQSYLHGIAPEVNEYIYQRLSIHNEHLISEEVILGEGYAITL